MLCSLRSESVWKYFSRQRLGGVIYFDWSGVRLVQACQDNDTSTTFDVLDFRSHAGELAKAPADCHSCNCSCRGNHRGWAVHVALFDISSWIVACFDIALRVAHVSILERVGW